MPARKSRSRRNWNDGFDAHTAIKGRGVQQLTYRLSALVKGKHLSAGKFSAFQQATGLADFSWRLLYNTQRAGKRIARHQAMRGAQGFVVFIHGWDGSGAIWASLPAEVCRRNDRLICLVPDVNGFGGSPFIEAEMPRVEHCDPPGCMSAVELWLDLLKLRSPRSRRVFTFVGHSMGGAALFFKDQRQWADSEYSLCAIAPALLANDTLRKGFYMTMGVGIGAGLHYEILDRFKEALAPAMVEGLIAGASHRVKQEHRRIFASTAKGTLAQTFWAMGSLKRKPTQRDWSNAKVILGHKDRLVALRPTLSLLEELGLKSANIQVVFGDHYLFSVGRGTRRTHGENIEVILSEILSLHEACYARRGKELRR
jgi:pimeloyl-ACP methyl ester carboxylesterase